MIKFFKNTLWPIIVGIIGLVVFLFVMNVSFDILTALSSIPLLRLLLLLNVSILGVDIISVEAFTIGSISAMLLMALLTKYDRYEEGHCYAKASRTCGVFYVLYLLITFYVLFTEYTISLKLITNMTPYLLFAFMLLSGSKFE